MGSVCKAAHPTLVWLMRRYSTGLLQMVLDARHPEGILGKEAAVVLQWPRIVEYHLLQPTGGRQTIRSLADPYAGQASTDTDRFAVHRVGGEVPISIGEGVYCVVDVDHPLGRLGLSHSRVLLTQRLPCRGQEPAWVHHDDITACPVAAGSTHTVGLRADGTVVAAGNNQRGQCDVTGWYAIRSSN
jgi:hypothetical protein